MHLECDDAEPYESGDSTDSSDDDSIHNTPDGRNEVSAVQHNAAASDNSDNDHSDSDDDLWDPMNLQWTVADEDFMPRFTIPDEEVPMVCNSLRAQSTALDVFLKVFPRSLINYMVDCMKERLKIFEDEKTFKSPNLTMVKC